MYGISIHSGLRSIVFESKAAFQENICQLKLRSQDYHIPIRSTPHSISISKLVQHSMTWTYVPPGSDITPIYDVTYLTSKDVRQRLGHSAKCKR